MKLFFSYILLFTVCFCTFAQKQTVIIEGNIVQSKGRAELANITKEKAKKLAFERAEYNANAKLGSYVMSQSFLKRISINKNFHLQSYSKCSKVLACSKLTRKSSVTKWVLNKDNEPIAVVVEATFSFKRKSFEKEIKEFLRNSEQINTNNAIGKQKEFDYINKEFIKADKQGNVVKMSELTKKRGEILSEVGEIFYNGRSIADSLSNVVKKHRTTIYSLIDKKLKDKLSQQNQYGYITVVRMPSRETGVGTNKHKVILNPFLKWHNSNQRKTLDVIESCKSLQFPNISGYKKFIYRRLKRLDKGDNEFVFKNLKKNRFEDFILERNKCYQRVEFVLQNINDKILKRFWIATIPINESFDYSSINRKMSLPAPECKINPNTHGKVDNCSVKQTNLEFFRNIVGLQFFANFSSITLDNNENSFQVPIYNTENKDNNLSLEFNTLINLNMGKPNSHSNATRFRLGVSLSYRNFLKKIDTDLNNKNIFTQILTSSIVAFEYGKLKRYSYNGFGISCKLKSWRTISQMEKLNTLSFYDYTDEFSFYIITKAFLIGASYHYSVFKHNQLKHSDLSTFSLKFGLNIW